MAVVQPHAFGGDSYAIVALRTTKGVRAQPSALIQKVYPVTEDSDLRLQRSVIEPDLLTGSSGPSKPFGGPRRVEGGITVPLGDTHAGLWLKLLTGDQNPTTTAIGGGTVRAAAAYTAGTALGAIPAAMQPHMLIADPVDAGQLSFVFASATGAGSIDVVGTDQLDNDIDEIIAFDTPGTHQSTKYYKTITSVTPRGAVSGGTLAITCATGLFQHELTVQEKLTNGADIELVKGGIPSTYLDVHVASATLNIGEFITLAMTMIGRNGLTRKNISGAKTPSSVTGYDRFNGNVNLGFQTLFKVDDEIFPLISGGLEFSQNLEVAERLYRSLFALGVQRAPGTRTARITADIDYTEDADFDARTEGDVIKAELSTAHLPGGGKHTSITFLFEQAVVVQYPDPGLAAGAIPQSLDIRGFTTGAGSEMKIIVINDEAASAFGG